MTVLGGQITDLLGPKSLVLTDLIIFRMSVTDRRAGILAGSHLSPGGVEQLDRDRASAGRYDLASVPLLTSERRFDPVLKLPEPFMRNDEPEEVFELS